MRQLLLTIISLILLQAAPGRLYAAPRKKALQDKALAAACRTMGQLDAYSFRTNSTQQIIGDTTRIPAEQTLSYMSRKDFIYYSRSARQVSLICEKGQFRADLIAKKIYYTPYTDTMPIYLKRLYTGQRNAAGLDTMMLQDAVITTHKQQKLTQYYQLSFGTGSTVKDMQLTFTRKDTLPTRLEMTVEREIGPDGLTRQHKGVLLRQHITSDQYIQEMPQELIDILDHIKDLEPYLRQTYPGYTLEKI